MRKNFGGLWSALVVTVFCIMLVTALLMSVGGYFLMRMGLLRFGGPNPYGRVITALFASIVIGSIVTAICGRTILRPILNLSRATKEVAKGDFSIRLPEEKGIAEFRELSGDFNRMVQELGGIKMLRDDFIVNVSHEFRNSLASVEGYTTLLQDADLTDLERNEYTSIIIESVRKLSVMSENILKLSKLENQGILEPPDEFDLDEQLRQALVLLEPQWSAKKLNLELDLNPVRITGCEEMIMQVWLNLFGNAIKFTPLNGEIFVSCATEDGNAVIKIADNGIGMSEQTKARIFEKFYQGDTAHMSEGNGLGLCLVKRIVDLCEGEIKVVSELEKGTAFIISYPVCKVD